MPDFIADKEPTHTTTVTIPRSMANWVVQSGMTYSGAYKQGIAAMQERKSWNQELADVTANMTKYRDRMLRLETELRALGKKVD